MPLCSSWWAAATVTCRADSVVCLLLESCTKYPKLLIMVADCTEAFICSTWHLLCKYQLPFALGDLICTWGSHALDKCNAFGSLTCLLSQFVSHLFMW